MKKSKIKEVLGKPLTWLILVLIAIFIAWSIEPVWKDPVTNFVEKTILHKKSDLRITITSVYFLNRSSTDIIDLPKTLGYMVNRDGEIVGLDTEHGNFTTLIIDDKLIIYPNFPAIIQGGICPNNTKCCLIDTLMSKGHLEANKTIPTKAWFEIKFLENPNCESCLKHTISVYNDGNKEIEDVRVKVCAANSIYNITGNDQFWVYDDKCFELRRQTFLERDEIVGNFIQKTPKKYTINDEPIESEEIFYNVSAWNDGQIEAIQGIDVDVWSKNQDYIEQEKIWNICIIVIPYCTPGW